MLERSGDTSCWWTLPEMPSCDGVTGRRRLTANRSRASWKSKSRSQRGITDLGHEPAGAGRDVADQMVIPAGSALTQMFNAVPYRSREPAVIVAVVNLKGGCGKST